MGDGEEAAFPVFEAVLVAIMVITAILFVTLSSNPVREVGASGIDLTELSDETLQILVGRPADDPAYANRLEEIVALAMIGDVGDVTDFLDEVVPQGTRWALRLDNGLAPLQLAPDTDLALTRPRDAAASAVFIYPDWTANSGATASYAAGEVFDWSGWSDLVGPDGSATGPGGESWDVIWADLAPDRDVIPPAVPFGEWDCNGCGFGIRITPPDGTVVDRPLYAVELLLWDGL